MKIFILNDGVNDHELKFTIKIDNEDILIQGKEIDLRGSEIETTGKIKVVCDTLIGNLDTKLTGADISIDCNWYDYLTNSHSCI
ncbi:MAG: hypothetical protein K0Q51_876 [Rickettsiaceae bacterium]|jgi:hypothetical protein|nr:hypothetical protein [Rickettsiaceae bacterium]